MKTYKAVGYDNTGMVVETSPAYRTRKAAETYGRKLATRKKVFSVHISVSATRKNPSTYTVYADRQGGGYFCWYTTYDGETVSKQVHTKDDVKNFARRHLDGLNYKIVYTGN